MELGIQGNNMQVMLGNGKIIGVELVKENPKTIWVKLPDGKVIKRHKEKHVVMGDTGETLTTSKGVWLGKG